MANNSVEELVYFASIGDDNAINALFNIFCEKVYHSAYIILNNKENAAKVTEDTFIDLCENIHKFTEYDIFELWLKEIVFRHCKEYFVSRPNMPGDSSVCILPEHFDFTPPKGASAEILLSDLINLLDNLSEIERGTALLFCCNNLTCKEIAFVESVSISDVIRLISIIKLKLEKVVENRKTTYETKNKPIPFADMYAWAFSSYKTDALGVEQAYYLSQNIYASTGIDINVVAGQNNSLKSKGYSQFPASYTAKYRNDPAFKSAAPKPEPVVAPKPEPVVVPKPEPEPVVAPKPEPVVAPELGPVFETITITEENELWKKKPEKEKSVKKQETEIKPEKSETEKKPAKTKKSVNKKSSAPKVIMIILIIIMLLCGCAFAVVYYLNNFASDSDNHNISDISQSTSYYDNRSSHEQYDYPSEGDVSSDVILEDRDIPENADDSETPSTPDSSEPEQPEQPEPPIQPEPEQPEQPEQPEPPVQPEPEQPEPPVQPEPEQPEPPIAE